MKPALTLILLILLALPLQAAQALYRTWEQADELYRYRHFEQAAALYEKVAVEKLTYDVAHRLADCYIHLGFYAKALPWTTAAVRFGRHTPADELRNMQMMLINGKYAEARAAARQCISLLPATLDLIIASADSAIQWKHNPTSCIITWLRLTPDGNGNGSEGNAISLFNARKASDSAACSDVVNTAGSDWGLVKFSDNEYVYTSNDNDSLAFARLGMQAPQRLYVSRNGQKSTPLFPPDQHELSEASPCFSADGNEVFYAASRAPKASPLDVLSGAVQPVHVGIFYRRKMSNGAWGAPTAFVHNNEDMYSVSDPFLTADGKRLYFASDFPKGDGICKIFYADRHADGTFGYPVCLDAPINNDGHSSRFPYFDPQGNFYFATDGLPGLGGLDIFKVRVDSNGDWGKPENMRYPFNSSADDFAPFFLSEQEGYLSSNRAGGRGSDDIYAFDLAPNTIAYHQIIEHDDSNESPEQMLGIADINTLAPDAPITLRNITYRANDWDIRADGAKELQKVVALLLKYPSMVIEVASHTDNRGTSNYNLNLSQRRAEAIASYICSFDIAKARVVPRGYGATKPKVECGTKGHRRCTEKDYRLNRRTEIFILNK